jgi:integrase
MPTGSTSGSRRKRGRPTLPPRLDQAAAGTWYIRWHDGNRDRRTSTRTTDQVRAERQLEDFLARRGEAAQQLRRPDEVAIAEAIKLYLLKIRHKPGAKPAATRAIALLGYWGRLTDRRGHSRDGRRLHRAPPTIARAPPAAAHLRLDDQRRIIGIARRAEQHGENGRLTRAPFVELLPEPPSRDIWFEHYEAELLIESCAEPHLALFTEVTLHSAARKTAVCELQWRGQIDFTWRRISLNPPGRPQTAKRRPVVPMTEHIYEVLLAAHARSSSTHVIEYGRRKRGEEERAVKRTPVGDVKSGVAAAMHRARRAAVHRARAAPIGSEARERWRIAARKFRWATAHTLRHTAATWMVQAGTDLGLVGGYLGISQARTTALYAHHHPDYLREAAAAIEQRAAQKGFPQLAGNSAAALSFRGPGRPNT